MNRILLVARRDFLQIIATRAFKITLLIVPLMLGLVILGTSFLRPPPTVAYIVADAGGSIAPVIAHRVELDYQRQVLRDLSAYAARWKLPPPGDTGYQADDAAVEAFIAHGGADGALARMHPPAGATAFKPPAAALSARGRAAGCAGGSGRRRLRPRHRALSGERHPDAAGQAPAGRGGLCARARTACALWTNGRGANGLIDMIQQERTHQLRMALLAANGVSRRRRRAHREP